MSARLVAEVAACGTNPDIQIYDDDIKKLEVPPLGLIKWSSSVSDDKMFMFNGDAAKYQKVGAEIKEKNGTITLGTKDGLVELKFSAQIFFDSLLAKFDKSCRSLFDTDYGRGILKDLREEYIKKSFYEKGRLCSDHDFVFDGIGVVKSAGEPLMVARKLAFTDDGYINVDELFGLVKLQDIMSPEITFFLDGGKKILIDRINKLASSNIPSKVDSLYRMVGAAHIVEDDDQDIPVDPSLEGEAFEEAALQYLSSQRKKTHANFDDLMLD